MATNIRVILGGKLVSVPKIIIPTGNYVNIYNIGKGKIIFPHGKMSGKPTASIITSHGMSSQ